MLSKISLNSLGLVLSIHLAASTAPAASSPHTRHRQGINLYDQGNYQKSVTVLEGLFRDGHINGHLLYNLGNAHYRYGNRGAAIAAWLAARELLPRDPDIRANLKFALESNQDRLSAERGFSSSPAILFWIRWMTSRELFIIFSALSMLALICGILSATLKATRTQWKAAGFLVTIPALISVTALLFSLCNGFNPAAVRSPRPWCTQRREATIQSFSNFTKELQLT